MSHYYLFNTKNNENPVDAWNSTNVMDHIQYIGGISETIEKLKCLYPRLQKWCVSNSDKHGMITHGSLGENNCSEEVYLDISVLENNNDKNAYFIIADRATDEILKNIMHEFNLKHVFYPEAWKLIDVE